MMQVHVIVNRILIILICIFGTNDTFDSRNSELMDSLCLT